MLRLQIETEFTINYSYIADGYYETSAPTFSLHLKGKKARICQTFCFKRNIFLISGFRQNDIQPFTLLMDTLNNVHV